MRLIAPDDHDCDENRDDDACQPRGDSEAVDERGGHRVDLDRVANPEGCDRSEDREREPQVLAELRRELADAVAQVVHRSADEPPRGVLLAIGDRAHRLGVLRRHAEQRDEPHVEDRAWSAEGDGGRDAGDVPRADGGRQRGHERVEGLDLAFADGAALVEQQPEAVAHLAPGHEDEAQGEQHTRDARMPSMGGPHANELTALMMEFSRSIALSVLGWRR